jgi:hypothetical protein
MIAGKPVSDRDGYIRFPAMAYGEIRKPVNGVTVLDEMPYKNWRNQRFPAVVTHLNENAPSTGRQLGVAGTRST